MERGDYAFGAIFLSLIAALSFAANTKVGHVDSRSHAVASALRETDLWKAAELAREGNQAGENKIVLCVETGRRRLDFEVVRGEVDNVLWMPIDAEFCSSTRTPSSRPMSAYDESWRGPEGDDALAVRINEVVCESADRCQVVLSGYGSATRYFVEKRSSGWTIAKRELVAIV